MRETASTTLGRNALSTGLVSHFAALIAGMMASSGSEPFFFAAYGFACLAFALGAYAELKDRGYSPLKSVVFYAGTGVSVLPVIGPVAVLLILYAAQGERKTGPFTIGGMLASIPRLKVNPLVLFFFLTILFILFALSAIRHDPYFR